jgi:hypothetical protein
MQSLAVKLFDFWLQEFDDLLSRFRHRISYAAFDAALVEIDFVSRIDVRVCSGVGLQKTQSRISFEEAVGVRAHQFAVADALRELESSAQRKTSKRRRHRSRRLEMEIGADLAVHSVHRIAQEFGKSLLLFQTQRLEFQLCLHFEFLTFASAGFHESRELRFCTGKTALELCAQPSELGQQCGHDGSVFRELEVETLREWTVAATTENEFSHVCWVTLTQIDVGDRQPQKGALQVADNVSALIGSSRRLSETPSSFRLFLRCEATFLGKRVQKALLRQRLSMQDRVENGLVAFRTRLFQKRSRHSR